MKLLHLISSADPRAGGPIEGCRKIDAQLLKLGHEVEVATLDDPSADFLDDHPSKVHALGPGKLGYQYAPAAVDWIKANRSRFDAVIVNGLWQYHGFAGWRALAGTNTPYFVFPHGMLDPWFKHTYPLKHLKKWMYWPWAEYRVLRDAASVIFTCDEERRCARDSFWLYNVKEAVTAYGTDLPPQDEDGALTEHFLKQYPELRGKRIFLFLSRIHEKKGCDLLIKAFAKVAANNPELMLVMAGPDQVGLKTGLQALAQKLGVGRQVVWPGMLKGKDKWGAFHAADVFCLPSHQENFGIVVAEALACGCPVLISNRVNIWREIDADGVGIVRDDTVEGTVDGLKTWIDMTPAEKERMRNATLPSFMKRYHIEKVANRVVEIIQPHVMPQEAWA